MARRRRAVLIPAAVLLVLLGTTSFASGRAATAVARCGFLRASVPYSHHGRHDRWRIYVKGRATCTRARQVLNAVLHLDAAQHVGSDNADSYFTYRAWRCDFGQMGYQDCWRPAHRPFTAGALAIDCAIADGGCPVDVPTDYVP